MEASEADQALDSARWIVREVWRLAAYVGSLDNEDFLEQVKELLEVIYQTLHELFNAAASGELPLNPTQREQLMARYQGAATALKDMGEDRLWVFDEVSGTFAAIAGAPSKAVPAPVQWSPSVAIEPDNGIQLLEAVLEALHTIVGHEVAYGVQVELDDDSDDGRDQLAFTVQSVPEDKGRNLRRTTVVDRTIRQQATGQWRYVTRIARGAISGFRQVLDSLDDQPRTAQIQFAVTDRRCVAFLTYGVERALATSERFLDACASDHLEVITLPSVSSSSLRRSMVEAHDSWFARYTQRHRGSEDFRGWMGAIEQTLERLSSELWAPIDERLQRRSVQRVRVIPHKALHLIPFGALSRRTRFGRREYLIDAYDISYAPSFTLYELCRERSSGPNADQHRLTAVADPTGDLPFAELEVAEIGHHFAEPRRTILRGRQATRDSLTSVPFGTIFHYAGHGNYAWNDPLDSTLAFADGNLKLGQLFAGAISLAGTRLVTLSGCETSVTDPKDLADEWLGLASGFLFAGASQVISSLWAVDDLSSSMLLSAFYRKYIGERLPADRALREAQRWLRDKVDRRAAIRFADAAISRLEQRRRTALLEQAESAEILDRHREGLRKRRLGLKILSRRPFAHPFFWAPFTVSGADPSGNGGT